MKRFTLFVAVLLMNIPVRAYAPVCDRLDVFAAVLGGELVPWIGYPTGWELPADLEMIESVNFEDDGGVWLEMSPSTGERFVWYFDDYQTGGDGGAHNFCGPYRFTPDA